MAKNDRGSSKCNYMPSAPCSLVSWVLFLPLLNSWYFFSLKTYVALKDPSEVAFFSWTSTLGRFWLLIFYGIRELQLWIDAICVKGVGNQWIIFFFFIVSLLLSDGHWYGLCLVFYGLCHKPRRLSPINFMSLELVFDGIFFFFFWHLVLYLFLNPFRKIVTRVGFGKRKWIKILILEYFFFFIWEL